MTWVIYPSLNPIITTIITTIIITAEDWSPFILTELSQSWWKSLIRSVLCDCRHNHSGPTLSNDTPATPFTTVCCTKAEDNLGVIFVLLDDDDAWVWCYLCQEMEQLKYQELWDLLESLWGWLVSSQLPFQSKNREKIDGSKKSV